MSKHIKILGLFIVGIVVLSWVFLSITDKPTNKNGKDPRYLVLPVGTRIILKDTREKGEIVESHDLWPAPPQYTVIVDGSDKKWHVRAAEIETDLAPEKLDD